MAKLRITRLVRVLSAIAVFGLAPSAFSPNGVSGDCGGLFTTCCYQGGALCLVENFPPFPDYCDRGIGSCCIGSSPCCTD